MIEQPKYKDRTNDMNGIYWQWAENILMKEPYVIADAQTSLCDMFQNDLVNVHRGLNSYGWIKMYEPMSKLLMKKKLYGREHTLANYEGNLDSKAKLELKITAL